MTKTNARRAVERTSEEEGIVRWQAKAMAGPIRLAAPQLLITRELICSQQRACQATVATSASAQAFPAGATRAVRK